MYDITELPDTIYIGKRGTSGTIIQFDLEDWLTDNPAGTATIHAIRPTEAESYAYTPDGVGMNEDGTTLEWTVDDTDTELYGVGFAELYLTAGTDIEIYTFHTTVEYAIGDTSGTLTDPRVLTTAGDLLTFTTEPARVAIGAAGSILQSTGTAPGWLAIGADGYFLKSNGSAPSWAAPGTRYVTKPDAGNSSGTIGDWSADASYIYACYATDTWIRCAITVW